MMSKWLSIELSLLLLVSLVAFGGLVSWQNTGNDVTGELSLYYTLPKIQLREVKALSVLNDKAVIFGNIGYNSAQAMCDAGERVVSGGGDCNAPGELSQLSREDIPTLTNSNKIGLTNAKGVMLYGWQINCIGRPSSVQGNSSRAVAMAMCTKD